MKRLKLIIAAIILIASTGTDSFGQCVSFVKKNCGEALGEYVPTENFNAAKFMPGDEAEIKITFYENVSYRLLVCSAEILGDVSYQLIDSDGAVLFDNTEHEMTDHFDFKVAGTQELTLKLKVSEDNKAAIAPQSCVAILVGRKIDK